MDNAIAANDIAPALLLLKNDAAARDQLTLTQLIGDSIRGLTVADDGFSTRIFAALENQSIEPDYDPLAESG